MKIWTPSELLENCKESKTLVFESDRWFAVENKKLKKVKKEKPFIVPENYIWYVCFTKRKVKNMSDLNLEEFREIPEILRYLRAENWHMSINSKTWRTIKNIFHFHLSNNQQVYRKIRSLGY